MKKWKVKEVSQLFDVSVRTLHYYDEIGLLRPSMRLENGYRLYSEADLIRLQQIIALKFFGFDLSQIRTLMDRMIDAKSQFRAQSWVLKKQADQLLEASKALDEIVSEVEVRGSVPWESLQKTIEVYKMQNNQKLSWATQIFNEKQFEKFTQLNAGVTEEEMAKYGDDWEALVAEVQKHLHEDPYGTVGQEYAKKWMDLGTRFWSDQELGDAIWDAFKSDKFPRNHPDLGGWPGIPMDVVNWIDKAVGFMYSNQKK